MAAAPCASAVRVSGDHDGSAERSRADRHTNSAAATILRVALALVVVFASVALADQRDDAEKLKAFRDLNPDNRAASDRRVEFHLGYVEIHYLGMDWRIFYLPLLAPLPGARLEDAAKIPNPFELTGTPYASTMPPMFDKDRSWAVEREYRRIQRLTANEQQ